MTFKKFTLISFILVLACGAAQAADTVGLVNSQRIMFSHPMYDEATRFLLFLSRPLEGNADQILSREQNHECRQMIMQYSAQVAEFADMDRVISAEKDLEKKSMLWENRQNRLSELEDSLMRPIILECRQAVQAVMALKKMTVLIELDTVYYGGTDVTEDIVQQLKATSEKK